MTFPFHLSSQIQNVSRTFQLTLSISKQRCILGGCPANLFVYRTLLSESLTKMEQYKRQRIFRVDDLQQSGKVKLFELLERVSSVKEAKQLAFKVLDASHCAQSQEDCQIIENVLKLVIAESNSTIKYSFGAGVMRMYHYLDMPDEAFAAFKNQDVGNLFKDNTCHMLLMDLLYKHGQYSRATDVYFGMKRFNIDCTTMAFGSLYHINTSKSLRKSQSLLTHVTTNNAVSTRAVLFAAMHAVNQGEPSRALKTLKLKSIKQDTIAKNIELIGLCKLSQVREVLSILADMEHRTNDMAMLWGLRIYTDAWQAILTVIEGKSTKEEKEKFRRLEKKLIDRRVISRQSISALLDRVVPGDLDYKKQRAKRILHRTPSTNPS